MKVVAIIPAAGTGKRFGSKTPKQFLKDSGREVIAQTLERFNSCKAVDEIIVAAMPEHFVRLSMIVRKNNFRKVTTIVEGGKTRHDSVHNALMISGCSKNDIVLVHDSVRPFVSSQLIIETIHHAQKFKCAIPVLPISETVKKISKNDYVENTIDRSTLATAQTPQGFRFGVLQSAFQFAKQKRFNGTDESSIVEYAGHKVKIFPGEPGNIKITIKDDLKKLKTK